MFMIEKSLVAIMFVYAVSFGILTAQFVFADVFGVTLTNYNGVPIKTNLISITNIANINTSEQNITSTSRASIVSNPVTAAAGIAWELILLITGTYVFNVLYLLGVPVILIMGLVALYFMLLARAILGYIRGM